MENNKADAKRIQTSVLNTLEKKVDILTYIGSFGALIVASGYILSAWNINFLWLSSWGGGVS